MYPTSFEYYKVADLVDTQNNLARNVVVHRVITTMFYDRYKDAEPFTLTSYLVVTFVWETPNDDPYLIKPGYVWYDTQGFTSISAALDFAHKSIR